MRPVVWKQGTFAVLAIFLAFSLSVAQADTPPQPNGPPVSKEPVFKSLQDSFADTQPKCETWDQYCNRLKNPTDWFSWGADIQMREIYSNNTKTLNDDLPNHESHYERFRPRVWTTIKPMTDMEINARFIWEYYNFNEPPPTADHRSQGLFDNLNVAWKNFLNTPSQLKVGRQDIILGDGWLVADGTPLDGSITQYFDAVRYTYDINDFETTADLIFIDNHAQQDAWLQQIDNTYRPLAEQDESGAIVWLTNKTFTDIEINPYFMYKHAEKYLASGYNGDIYVPGLRFVQKVDKNWRYRLEGAYEFGSKDGFSEGPTGSGAYTSDRQALSAFGFNSQLNYFTNDELNNNYRLSYEFLSGDKPGNQQNEAFDVLWGRWARWSDTYADATVVEGGRPADFTNYYRVGPGWSFNPSKQIEIATDYYLLFADQNTFRANSANFSDNGAFRGQMLTSVLRYTINKNIKGHLQGEVYLPGNYYSSNRNDPAFFLRYEIIFTF